MDKITLKMSNQKLNFKSVEYQNKLARYLKMNRISMCLICAVIVVQPLFVIRFGAHKKLWRRTRKNVRKFVCHWQNMHPIPVLNMTFLERN